MLDIGWTELLVIGLLALLVVGPKELPGLLRTIGQYVGKAKSVAREFQRSMEDAAREADLGDLTQLKDAKRELDNLTRIDFTEQAKRSQSFLSPDAKSDGDEKGGAKADPDSAALEPTAGSAAVAGPEPAPESVSESVSDSPQKPEPAAETVAKPAASTEPPAKAQGDKA